VDQIIEKLREAGFACTKRGQSGDVSEEEGQPLVMLLMNQTFKDILDKLKVPTVNYLGEFANFYEMVQANYEDMINGMGEGLVLVCDNRISKWKNGSEANSSNRDMITAILDKIEKDNTKFGENTEKAIDLFNKLENI